MRPDNCLRSQDRSLLAGMAARLQAGAILVSSLFMVSAPCTAEVHQLGYSFSRDRGGGIAVVRIDAATGKFVDERILFESSDCTRPEKLRFDSQGNQYVLTNETDKKSGPHLYLVSTAQDAHPRGVTLPEKPDEVRIGDGFALLTCDGDLLVCVDLESARISGEWKMDKILDPPANGPQDIRFLKDGQTVVVSFQKDSGKGKKKGNRIAAFRWPDMAVVADAQLPRDHPELHIRGNDQEQGPGPEVIHIDEQGNRIVATLDLYGALAVAKLEPFLAGEDVTWQYISTAVDETWGNAFPDRMSAFQYDGQSVALVANSGSAGGLALLDTQRQEIVWRCASPPGLERPVFVASEGKAYSVCSGKRKVRGRRETEKTYLPQQDVFVLGFTVTESPSEPCLERISTDRFMFCIARVGNDEKPWLVLAGGLGNPDTLMILDPRTGKFVDERPATGSLMRFEQL